MRITGKEARRLMERDTTSASTSPLDFELDTICNTIDRDARLGKGYLRWKGASDEAVRWLSINGFHVIENICGEAAIFWDDAQV